MHVYVMSPFAQHRKRHATSEPSAQCLRDVAPGEVMIGAALKRSSWKLLGARHIPG